MSRIKTSVDMPYPECKVERMSKHDVCCLLEDFGGKASETTAIMQYMYQAYITSELDGDWHDLFESLAITEMRHHEMLGVAITRLGGAPVLGGCREFWSGCHPNYTRDLCTMLEVNLRGEKEAIANYKRTALCLENYSCREMIERIIKDEELHVTQLTDALAKAHSMSLCCR